MPDTPSIVIAKSFSYRGSAEVWTNKYHFEGDTPTTKAGWDALGLAIWNSEKPALSSQVQPVAFTGYAAGNDAAVYMASGATLPAGITTGSLTGGAPLPGDAAVWLRWSTPDRNSKNKPIYLRKYFHGSMSTTGSPDTVLPAARTALLAHGNKMIDGTLPGGVKICGPQGSDGSNPAAAQFTTTRTLKRNARTPT